MHDDMLRSLLDVHDPFKRMLLTFAVCLVLKQRKHFVAAEKPESEQRWYCNSVANDAWSFRLIDCCGIVQSTLTPWN
jgi:hypothetical protein